jgi:hypothetical protein
VGIVDAWGASPFAGALHPEAGHHKGKDTTQANLMGGQWGRHG